MRYVIRSIENGEETRYFAGLDHNGGGWLGVRHQRHAVKFNDRDAAHAFARLTRGITVRLVPKATLHKGDGNGEQA